MLKTNINSFFILLIISVLAILSLNFKPKNNQATVVFYNVENLYDTEDDPTIDDNEFLPTAKKQWTPERFQKKLNDLAKVLASTTVSGLPDFVGMAEIETRKVVEDLFATEALKAGNYTVVHENSPDLRGIDVAFAFKKGSFKYIAHEKIAIIVAEDTAFRTRDILHIWGTAGKKDTLHFFVNHWSSRRSGQDESEVKRLAAGKILKDATEKILKYSPAAKIIIMGDMNDEPKNKSLNEALGAVNPALNQPAHLYNLMYPADELEKGTYLFQKGWNMLDNLVVSDGLLHAKKGYKSAQEGTIHIMDFMTFTDKSGVKSPNRTYGGDNYYGGYSDHYPVYFNLIK